MSVATILRLAARHGRLCLVLGLVAGFLLPGIAAALRPWLGELVALLLLITALRVGPREALGNLKIAPRTLKQVVVLQLVAPVCALAVLSAFGLMGTPFALAVVLMLAAPSVTGSPNFAIMTGHDPAPAMRVLILGTALFPLTALPVLWGLPLGAQSVAFSGAIRLIVVILGATAVGFALRRALMRDPSSGAIRSLDGLAAIALAIVVVGLMSEIGPLVRSEPVRLLRWMVGVMALNLGLQLSAFVLLRRLGVPEAVQLAIISGNRNIALFLIALPDALVAPLLIFIGCYQVPMYLTPLIMRRLYASGS